MGETSVDANGKAIHSCCKSCYCMQSKDSRDHLTIDIYNESVILSMKQSFYIIRYKFKDASLEF